MPALRSLLYHNISSNLDKICAMTLAALVTFLIAQGFPIVELDANGLTSQTTLIGAIVALWSEQMEVMAISYSVSTILFPLARAARAASRASSAALGLRPAGLQRGLLRGIQFVRPWGMIEVFMAAACWSRS